MALTQKDIEDLINSVLKKEGEAEETRVAKPRLRVYDFRRPDKFSKAHLRGTQLLFDHYARQLTSYFSGLFRMAVHADVVSIDQMTYEEFVKGVSNPCCVAVVDWGDLPSNMLINMSLKVVLPMLDRLCGGSGSAPSISRTLTEIETGMTRRLSGSLVSILEGAVREFRLDHGELTVSSLEVNPLFVQQALPPGEMVLSASVAVKFGSQNGTLEFCLPFTLMEPLLSGLSANKWYSRRNPPSEDQDEAVSVALENVEVPLTCSLGGTVLSLEEVLSIREGDVLELDARADGPATLHVFGKPKFYAKVGLVGNRLAARIISLAEDGEGDTV